MRLSRFLILQVLLKVFAKECNRMNNTCCYNEHFDSNTNECVVCMNGSIGWNCKAHCKAGYYGYLCISPCECEAQLCDKETGCQSRHNKTTTIRTNSPILTTLSTIVSKENKSQEEYMETYQARKKPTFSGNIIQETTSEDVYIETSDQKRNISGTSEPNDTSSERRLQDSMSNSILFFIGSVTTVFIGGAFIYFRKRFKGIFFNRYLGRTQPTRTPPTDRDSGYDEILYSQLIRNCNICADVDTSSNANRMAGYSSKSQYVLSVIYDNYNDDDEDYSRLILKQNQGTCIPKRNILLEDEGYAFLQTSDIKELKPDIAVQKHRSLPRIATIQNQISSTEFKPLTRCLSENNVLRLKRFSPS